MRRNRDSDNGSLDLLLDTICNTFGGVLFISIFVVVLLNMSSKQASKLPPSEEAQAQLAIAQANLARSASELEKLEALNRLQTDVSDQIVDPELSKLLEAGNRLGQGIVKRVSQKVEQTQKISENQLTINERSQRIRVHSEQLSKAQQSAQSLETQLQQEIEARTKAAQLPKGQETKLTEVAMFLKNGKLTSYIHMGPNGLQENVAEIQTLKDDKNQAYIAPKPAAGVAINPDDDNPTMKARLEQFDPSKHYLAIFVWPDSFREFTTLKDVMVVMGSNIALWPSTPTPKVPTSRASKQKRKFSERVPMHCITRNRATPLPPQYVLTTTAALCRH